MTWLLEGVFLVCNIKITIGESGMWYRWRREHERYDVWFKKDKMSLICSNLLYILFIWLIQLRNWYNYKAIIKKEIFPLPIVKKNGPIVVVWPWSTTNIDINIHRTSSISQNLFYYFIYFLKFLINYQEENFHIGSNCSYRSKRFL